MASMDSVIGLDFKNEMPLVITKTIAATVTKAVAAYALNEAAQQRAGISSDWFAAVHHRCQIAVNIAENAPGPRCRRNFRPAASRRRRTARSCWTCRMAAKKSR